MSLDQLIREGARVTSRAEVWLDAAHVADVPIVDGAVVYDVALRVMRSCMVTLAADPPVGASSLLAPAGSHLHLYRGARDYTGEVFEEPVGRYGFDESASVRRSGTVTIPGYDYSQLVSDARWESPYEVTAGTTIDQVVRDALLSRLPWLTDTDLLLTPTTHAAPATVWGQERENDPWIDLTRLVEAAGMWLRWDRQGRARLDPVPDPDIDPVTWTYQPGEATYVDGGRRLFGRSYNVVVVRGEPADDTAPITATAEDDDPNSASYVGRYRRPYFLTSPYITTQQQGDEAAAAKLRTLVGLGEQATITAVPDPRRDVGQVVALIDPHLGQVDARYVIDAVTPLPLRPGEMKLITRRRRL